MQQATQPSGSGVVANQPSYEAATVLGFSFLAPFPCGCSWQAILVPPQRMMPSQLKTKNMLLQELLALGYMAFSFTPVPIRWLTPYEKHDAWVLRRQPSHPDGQGRPPCERLLAHLFLDLGQPRALLAPLVHYLLPRLNEVDLA